MKPYTAKISDYLTRTELKMTLLVIIIYIVGIAGITIPLTGEFFISLIPLVLILSLAVSLAFHRQPWDLRTISMFSGIVIISWIIEAAGVETGIIFGIYSYGPALGIKLLETPLLIGLNWLLMIYGTSGIAESLPLRAAGKIIAASLLMVIFDMILELAAPVLEMWQFEGGFAPPENYIAWFLMAVLFHSVLRISGIRVTNHVAPVIFIIQFIFFLVLIMIFHITQ